MPLPEDPATVETAGDLVKTLQGAFGNHPGYRPAHAKGRLVTGTFTPTPDAASLSTAPHFNNPSTPLIARFSSSTGIPNIPDTDANSNPRGMALRFVLGNAGHLHTDIIGQSTPYFPMRTGEGFLAMLDALGRGTIEDFLAANPSAAAFVQDPKPSPKSFATERYYGVNAFKFVSKDGQERFIRYRILPDAGLSHLSETELASKGPSYLFDELPTRMNQGPVGFKLLAQVAEGDDPTDDATRHWPEERKLVELGTIRLEAVRPEEQSEREQKRIIFDPIPRVEGIESSADPLLEMRAAVYLISGKERRAASVEGTSSSPAGVA
ncbi:heme-dependent catalase [Hortaea werneckii]|nr:heme-dependent catalase [Hortaea werneckii]KAI7588075.1 heme-dependent catalase [Hortaea werneckii]